MRKHKNTNCPACGFALEFKPWQGDSASDEICPCCGIQFGYTDAAGGDLSRRSEIYRKWRKKWIEKGMCFGIDGEPPPQGWDPEKQLRDVGLEG